jgi:hypothetical protein
MTTHSILIPSAIAATNIDSYNRPCVCASDVDNGNLLKLTTYGVASGESEVWTAVAPSAGVGLSGLWMAYEPELVWSGNYRGLDPDVRNYYTKATRVFSAFKPQVGDLFVITEDGLATGTGPADLFIKATNGSGVQPEWVHAVDLTVFCAKYIALTYISLATGAMDTQRITAYQFEVVSA